MPANRLPVSRKTQKMRHWKKPKLANLVKTDSLFYRIFHQAPALFFELIQQPQRQGYTFKSIEVKQTAFRIDGVFLPPAQAVDQPVFFVEVQFQKDPLLYNRIFAELFTFLEQNPTTADWQAAIIFPRRSLEPTQTQLYRTLLASDQVQRLYLNEIDLPAGQFSPALELMQLVIEPRKSVATRARDFLQQVQQTPSALPKKTIIDLITTTLVYKFPQLSREEIIAMLGIADSLKQTRFYQEGREEGREEGKEEEAVILILRQLNRRVGDLSQVLKAQIGALSLAQLEQLGEALLDFTEMADLSRWLQANPTED